MSLASERPDDTTACSGEPSPVLDSSAPAVDVQHLAAGLSRYTLSVGPGNLLEQGFSGECPPWVGWGMARAVPECAEAGMQVSEVGDGLPRSLFISSLTSELRISHLNAIIIP